MSVLNLQRTVELAALSRQIVEPPKPLVIDLYCGRGGWSRGFIEAGWRAIGFDLERHEVYPGELVLQHVLTIHGSQLRHAACIVGSSPCQEFSYRAMPWKRAKALPPPELGIELFQAQFRIQREASEAADRYIPMVVENVCGAQPWVGEAKAHFGSYYLWGDVDTVNGNLVCGLGPLAERVPYHPPNRAQKFNPDGTDHPQGSWFNGADHETRGVKCAGNDTFAKTGLPCGKLTDPRYPSDGVKQHGSGAEWWDKALDERRKAATKGYEGGLGRGHGRDPASRHNSKSDSRKQASAIIAEIPFDLAYWVAMSLKPSASEALGICPTPLESERSSDG